MNDEVNPYAAQPHAPEQVVASPDPLPGEVGMVHQVTVVSILQIVQGALELLMSLLVMTPVVVLTVAEDVEIGETEFWMMCLIYGILSLLALCSAIFRIVTGVRGLKFKGRMPLVFSLGFGLLTSITCYCGPTSIALAVYGLIVTLHPAVVKAFLMGAEGLSASEIKQRFQQANNWGPPNYPGQAYPNQGYPNQTYPNQAFDASPNAAQNYPDQNYSDPNSASQPYPPGQSPPPPPPSPLPPTSPPPPPRDDDNLNQ